jgi:hypothetical protein
MTMAHDTKHHEADHKPGTPSERRFLSEPTPRSNYKALIGGLGAAGLGAATYATLVVDTPLASGPFLFGAGTVAIVVAAVMGDPGGAPIHVGDIGVGVDRGATQLERIAWYEVDKILLEGDDVLVKATDGRKIAASTSHHPAAAGWIVKEGLARIPKRVAIETDRASTIMRGADEGGTIVKAPKVQIAGRRCKASDVIISFEPDARVCERCGEVYDKKHVPEKCLGCEAAM